MTSKVVIEVMGGVAYVVSAPEGIEVEINDLVANIKRILLDESLPPDNMSARSATEIVERMKELAQNLGSAFGRLINELSWSKLNPQTLMILLTR